MAGACIETGKDMIDEYIEIREAFDGSTGRPIRLPRNGRVKLKVGDIVRMGNEFLTLDKPATIVKITKKIDYETYHFDELVFQ